MLASSAVMHRLSTLTWLKNGTFREMASCHHLQFAHIIAQTLYLRSEHGHGGWQVPQH